MPHKWCKEIWRYILFWWPKRSFVPCNVVNPNQNNPGPNTRIYMTLDGPWAWSPCENGWQMDYASFGNFIDLLNDSLNSISRLLFFWLYREIWIYMGIPILIQSLVNLDFDLALVSGSPSSSLSRVAFSCCGNLGFAGTSLDLGAPNFLRRTRTLTHEPTRFWSDLAFNFPAPGTKFCSTVPANAIPSVHQCPANSEFEALAARRCVRCACFQKCPRRPGGRLEHMVVSSCGLPVHSLSRVDALLYQPWPYPPLEDGYEGAHFLIIQRLYKSSSPGTTWNLSTCGRHSPCLRPPSGFKFRAAFLASAGRKLHRTVTRNSSAFFSAVRSAKVGKPWKNV